MLDSILYPFLVALQVLANGLVELQLTHKYKLLYVLVGSPKPLSN